MTTPLPDVIVEIVGQGHAGALHLAAIDSVDGLHMVDQEPIRRRFSRRDKTSSAGLGRLRWNPASPAPKTAYIVATPPKSHLMVVGALVKRGVPVLVERPTTSTVAEIDQLSSLDADRGLVRYGENLLSSPFVRQAIERSHELDTIKHLSIRDRRPRPDWGQHGTAAFGGGALFGRGVSAISIVLEMLAPELPVSVSAHVRIGDSGVDEHSEVDLRFRNGLVCRIEVSWEGGPALWELQAATDTCSMRAELLPHPHLEENGIDVPHPVEDHLSRAANPLVAYGYVEQLRDFADRVRTGQRQRPGLDVARSALTIVLAAMAAAHHGSEIALPYEGPTNLTPLELLTDGA